MYDKLVCFQHLETVIRARIPSILSLIAKTIDELEAELDRLGRPIGGDAGVKMICFQISKHVSCVNIIMLIVLQL